MQASGSTSKGVPMYRLAPRLCVEMAWVPIFAQIRVQRPQRMQSVGSSETL